MSSEQNPVYEPWVGPWGAAPAFDKIQVAHFKPAIEEAMAAQLAELETITSNAAAATSRAPSSPSRDQARRSAAR